MDEEFNLINPDSHKLYRRLVENAKDGIFMANKDGHLIYANHSFLRTLDYHTKDQVLGLNLTTELFQNTELKSEFLHKMSTTGSVQNFEIKKEKKDGGFLNLSITSHYIRNESSQVIGFEGVVHDITEIKHLQNALVKEKHKLESMLSFGEKIHGMRDFEQLSQFIVDRIAETLESKRCSLMLIDEDTQSLYMQCSHGTKDPSEEQASVKLNAPICGIVAQEREAIIVPNIEYDERFKRANRSKYITRSFMIAPLIFENEILGVLNVADKITSKHNDVPFDNMDLKILTAMAREVSVVIGNLRILKELNIQVKTDPLTHIFNFRQFSDSLDHEIKRAIRTKGDLSLIMMDVDHFKSYNDSFGHPEGDALLKGIGKILKSSLRASDIVCRYAGDEFVVILPDTKLEGAKEAAEKIVEIVRTYAFKRKVTVSLGLAQYEEGMVNADLVKKADKALYQTKEKGKDGFSVLE